jgi:predicted nucleic acid-binding Zn ribbon protein
MMPRPPRRNPPLGPPKLSPREQTLVQWRGLDLTPLEKGLARPAQAIQHVMPRVLTNLRMDRRRGEAEIARVWNHLIDPVLIAHAQPTGLHKGTLFVTVDSSVWLDEIVRYRRKEILDRLQHSFGRNLVTRISFRVG